MTTVPVTPPIGGAAAQLRRRLEREEVEMTKYTADTMKGWEFKIVRAATRKFKDPAIVRQICDEEARSGWELLEKFDDYRMGFKRKGRAPEERPSSQYRSLQDGHWNIANPAQALHSRRSGRRHPHRPGDGIHDGRLQMRATHEDPCSKYWNPPTESVTMKPQ